VILTVQRDPISADGYPVDTGAEVLRQGCIFIDRCATRKGITRVTTAWINKIGHRWTIRISVKLALITCIPAIITSIAETVGVRVVLIRVGYVRAVVNVAADTIGIDIVQGVIRAGITHVTNPIIVRIVLVRVDMIGAVVARVPYPIPTRAKEHVIDVGPLRTLDVDKVNRGQGFLRDQRTIQIRYLVVQIDLEFVPARRP
jgi:hypothetical protein